MSRAILRCGTSPQGALAAAERLIGQWPHARPPDAKTYSAAIAAVLAGYPQGVVDECADPRIGLARTREFLPTPAAVVAWCDERMEFHKTLAGYRMPKEAPPEANDPLDPAVRDGLRELADSLRPPERDPEADKARNAAAFSKRCAGVVSEWGNERAPTCGGIPISRGLTEILKRPPGSSMRNFG